MKRKPVVAQRSLFGDGIQDRFERYHEEHPEVLAELLRLARKIRARGFRRYSIKTLWEVLRWHSNMKLGPDAESPFEYSNDYHSRYARLIMELYTEEFAGFFSLRELRSA